MFRARSIPSSSVNSRPERTAPAGCRGIYGDKHMTTEEYLRGFLPAPVMADFEKSRPAYHPESLFNSDEDRDFIGLVLALEHVAEKIGAAVFVENGRTEEDAREFYDQGFLDDECSFIADEIQCRKYADFKQIESFFRSRALGDIADALLFKALD